MPASSTTVLDQIAQFFILLSGAPVYWFIINASCDHASQLSKWLGINVTINLAIEVMGGGDESSAFVEWSVGALARQIMRSALQTYRQCRL
jgi:hypothetical protein